MYRLKTVSVWHVRNRSNRFAGGRLFTVNNLPQVKCNLYHPYSRWCRKACRCLREILTYRDQRSRCVRNNIGPRTEPCGTPDETEILPEFMFRTMFSLPSEPATFVQRLPNVFQTSMAVHGVWNTLSSRCTNVAGSLGEPYAILNDI